MPKSHRFLTPIDEGQVDIEEGTESPPPAPEPAPGSKPLLSGGELPPESLKAYSDSGMEDAIIRGADVQPAKAEGPGRDRYRTDELEIDLDAAPARLAGVGRPGGDVEASRPAPAGPTRRRDPGRVGSPAGKKARRAEAPGAAIRPRPRPPGRTRSAAGAGKSARLEEDREFQALEVKKPKTALFLAMIVFVGLGVAAVAYKIHRDRTQAEALRAPFAALSESRQPLYDVLAAKVAGGEPVADDYCPPIGDPAEDVTMVFSGQTLPGFPGSPRADRELQTYQTYVDGEASRAELDRAVRAIRGIGPAVAWVRGVNWRLPQLGPHATSAGRFYNNVVPGFVIGDAFVGNADTGQPVCSFRFFASSSREIRREGEADQDLLQDLRQQTDRALQIGMRGVRAEPGVSVGRYPLQEPPPGF